jgi:hypothetical protein
MFILSGFELRFNKCVALNASAQYGCFESTLPATTQRHHRASIGMDQRPIAPTREMISLQPVRRNRRNERGMYWLLANAFVNVSTRPLLI